MTDTHTDNPVLADLSSKQREVLDLVVDRRTNKEISVILGISPSAVEQRLQSVRRKFGVQGRADLARSYLRFLDACQNQSGAEMQVLYSALLGEGRGESFSHSSELSGRAPVDTNADSRRGDHARQVRAVSPSLLGRLDAASGLSGRIAAITTTAATFAFLVVLVTGAS